MFSPEVILWDFFFHVHLFDAICFKHSDIFVISFFFFYVFWCFLDWVVLIFEFNFLLFLSLFLFFFFFFTFSLSVGHIFQSQFPFVYPGCRFFFYLINTKSGFLSGSEWSICISESQRILCLSFSKADSDWCIYSLSVGSSFNLLHISHPVHD